MHDEHTSTVIAALKRGAALAKGQDAAGQPHPIGIYERDLRTVFNAAREHADSDLLTRAAGILDLAAPRVTRSAELKKEAEAEGRRGNFDVIVEIMKEDVLALCEAAEESAAV